MKSIYVLFLILVIGCGHKKDAKQSKVSISTQVPSNGFITVDFEGFEEYIKGRQSQLVVVNFWATWCTPCIKEIPYFEQIGVAYEKQDVEVILVSLDFPDQIERLEKFIKDRRLASEIVLLNDGNANEWIPKVDANWSGAIPATIIDNGIKRKFYERSFTYEELEEEIKIFL